MPTKKQIVLTSSANVKAFAELYKMPLLSVTADSRGIPVFSLLYLQLLYYRSCVAKFF